MRHEDVWGSLDERWGSGVPVKRFKRYFWRGFALACLVLLFGAFTAPPSMPLWLADSVGNAAKSCAEAMELPQENDCSQTVWTACEGSRSWWETGRTSITRVPIGGHEGAIFYPKEFLCRAAHMAELAELAVVLADVYGDEFWVIDGNFWRFRVYMTYTPWSRYDIYFPMGSGAYYVNARWLNQVSDDRGMSDNSVRALNSLLSRVSAFTETYDSLPSSASTSESELKAIEEELTSNHWPSNLFDSIIFKSNSLMNIPLEIPETDNETTRRCRKSLIAARTSTPGWETDIEQCISAAADCINERPTVLSTCNSLSALAELEYQWQNLPKTCASTHLTRSPDDICRRAALDICRDSKATGKNLGRYLYRRLTDIKEGACVLAKPLIDLISDPN